jgi:hypothetical protein
MTLVTNLCMMRFKDRAERVDRKQIIETFVEVGPLLNILESENNQVIYGRRGVGKTHALLFLADKRSQIGDIVCYIDCRTLGSNSSIYSDPSIDASERSSRLLIDFFSAVHESILDTITDPKRDWDFSSITPALDELLERICDIKVVGPVSSTWKTDQRDSHGTNASAGMELAPQPKATAAFGYSQNTDVQRSREIQRTGTEIEWIDFGGVTRALEKLTKSVPGKRIWILVDEWSAIPSDLQPHLADMIRRTIFVNSNVTVKIGAIEHRSAFVSFKNDKDYIGIEMGSDMTPAIDLDDYLVFDRDSDKSMEFYRTLISKHIISVADELSLEIPHRDDLIQYAFTQENVFREFVVSTEGVPRDALHILQRAATRADADMISMQILKNAVHGYYQTDKYNSINSNNGLRTLLEWIHDNVIGGRRTRAFLLPVGTNDPMINDLFDRRALHILNRSMSAAHRPGERFVVYKLDYGCYVDLKATEKFPTGLLFSDDSELLDLPDVPDDDARSFRRAILELGSFYQAHPQLAC